MRVATYEIGFLLRRSFRNILESYRFRGGEIEWTEQRGLLSSMFLVRASDSAINQINRLIEDEGE